MNPDNEALHAILEAKYARIILAISELHDISLDEATEMFYNSPLLPLIEEGVGDLHCRSDKYLAEEIWYEAIETTKKKGSLSLSFVVGNKK